MNKKESRAKGVKYLVFLPLAALLMLQCQSESTGSTSDELTSDEVTSETTEQVQTKAEVIDGTVFTVVEKMPVFPGGEGELLKFLSKNIEYPVIAQENGIQGRVICSFIIKKDGSIANPKVERSVDASLDAEAIRVIGLMPVWTPGKQRGEAVHVKYTIPVTFRLQGADSSQAVRAPLEVTLADDSDPSDPVYRVADEMPSFPGGEVELLKFIGKNVVYPVEAQEKGVDGRVICKFVVRKDGSITNIKVIRGINEILDEESLRVLATMPKWIPGKVKGEVVNTEYVVPITFKLQ